MTDKGSNASRLVVREITPSHVAVEYWAEGEETPFRSFELHMRLDDVCGEAGLGRAFDEHTALTALERSLMMQEEVRFSETGFEKWKRDNGW